MFFQNGESEARTSPVVLNFPSWQQITAFRVRDVAEKSSSRSPEFETAIYLAMKCISYDCGKISFTLDFPIVHNDTAQKVNYSPEMDRIPFLSRFNFFRAEAFFERLSRKPCRFFRVFAMSNWVLGYSDGIFARSNWDFAFLNWFSWYSCMKIYFLKR